MEKSKQIERYCHDSSKDIGEKPAQEPGIYVKPAVVKLISRQTAGVKLFHTEEGTPETYVGLS